MGCSHADHDTRCCLFLTFGLRLMSVLKLGAGFKLLWGGRIPDEDKSYCYRSNMVLSNIDEFVREIPSNAQTISNVSLSFSRDCA